MSVKRKKDRRGGQATPAPAAAPAGGLAGRGAVVLAAVVLLGVWSYSTSFRGVFVYDDRPAIVDNPYIRSLWPLTDAMRAPSEAPVSGRPVVSLTLALNYALAPADARDVMAPAGRGLPPGGSDAFSRNVWGYHAVNLLIHLLAALTLFGVVRRSLLMPGLRERYGTAAAALAASVAIIWLVHPLNTQAVTYVVRRIESLMGLFFLLTLYGAIRALGSGNRRRWWTAASIAACALGMGTKEVMAGAPLIVWLWDLVFGVDRRQRRFLYAGLASTWIILAVLVAFEQRPESVGFGLGWTWWAYLQTQAAVIVHYLRLSFVPWPLVFDYGWPKAASFAAVAPQALAVGALVAISAVALLRRHPAGLAGAWFFIVLAPTSSVLPIVTEVAAEHRMYLPLAAVVLLAVVGVYEAGRRVARAPGRSARASRVAIAAGMVMVCATAAVFAEMTRARNRDYWSDEGLWLDTVQKRPANPQARIGYAINLLAAQRWSEAEQQLETAVELEPTNGRAHMNLGSALAAQGRLDEGVRHLERARELTPDIRETWGLLGQAYWDQGRSTDAAAMFERAVALMPDNAFLLNGYAWVLATSSDGRVRDGARAVEYAERALRLSGGRPAMFLLTLAAAIAESGRMAGAVEVAREGLSRAEAEGDRATAAELRWHLANYEAGRPVRLAR